MSSENKVVSLRQGCHCRGAFCGPKSRDVRRGAATNPALQVDFCDFCVFHCFSRMVLRFSFEVVQEKGWISKFFHPNILGFWFPTVEIHGPELDQ